MTAPDHAHSPVAVGDTGPRRLFGPIKREDIVRYAGASGDFNPLHHDDAYARAAGFPTVFSMGMFQAGMLATFATDWLGASNVRRFTVRFQEQVWPGDVLVCEGTVTDIRPEAVTTGSRVTVELTCSRKEGGVAIAATAEFSLPVAADAPPST